MRDGTLVLNVIHGNELEVEYEKNEIIDKNFVYKVPKRY